MKATVNINKEGKAYITKRLVVSSSRAAVRLAALRAMQTAGYVIKAHKGWIVRVEKDGTIYKISKYAPAKTHPVVLD